MLILFNHRCSVQQNTQWKEGYEVRRLCKTWSKMKTFWRLNRVSRTRFCDSTHASKAVKELKYFLICLFTTIPLMIFSCLCSSSLIQIISFQWLASAQRDTLSYWATSIRLHRMNVRREMPRMDRHICPASFEVSCLWILKSCNAQRTWTEKRARLDRHNHQGGCNIRQL